MTMFTFDPIFDSSQFLLQLTKVILAVPWLVPVAGRAVTHSQRRTLQWLRTGTAVLLLLAVFRPSIVRTDSVPTEATIAVLLDRSRSMTLPADEKSSRSAVQNEVFQKLLPAIDRLDDSLTLKTLVYAGETSELPIGEAALQSLSVAPTGAATDITRALAVAVQSSASRPLAGVVLIGDGVEVLPTNDRSTTLQRDPQTSARLLASLDIPLWSVAIGPPGDLDQVRDAEVAELGESYSLFAGNETDIGFVVRTRALTGKSFSVRLTMIPENADGTSLEVATRTITPTKPEESTPMSVPIIAPAAGNYRLEVSVEPQDGETLLSNNSQIAFVEIREGGGRVLYLEGQPRPEQKFLLQTLRRFPDLQVSYRWLAGDNKKRWPIDLGLTDASRRFDIFLIGDLPAEAIGEAQLSMIAKRVGEGASLIMIGGIETYAAGGYDKSPLAKVIPVKLSKELADFTGEIQATLAKPHPITNLNIGGDQKAQSEAWKSLPPFIGANQFFDLRVAPGIEVLLETSDGNPLLVVGEYGSGRVAALAVDSTYRWWRQGKSMEHRRFWRQLMLWLLNRDADLSDGIDISLAKRRAELGQSIDYVVTYPNQKAANQPALQLSVLAADGTSTAITPDLVSTTGEVATQDGKLSGLAPGMYRMRAMLAGSNKEAVERSFQILDQEAELRQPFADHSYLSQLAGQTAAAGGAMFLADQTDELIDLITQLRRSSQAPVVQKYRLGDTPASAWPLFVILAGLLGSEWYLRRRWGLA